MADEMATEPTTGGGKLSDIWSKLRDVMTTRTVIGEPVVAGDVTIIPMVRCSGMTCQCHRGGHCGCGCHHQGEAPEEGHGEHQDHAAGTCEKASLAVCCKPLGAFAVKHGHVRWRPAIDVNKVILGGQIVGVTALLVIRSVVRARRHR